MQGSERRVPCELLPRPAERVANWRVIAMPCSPFRTSSCSTCWESCRNAIGGVSWLRILFNRQSWPEGLAGSRRFTSALDPAVHLRDVHARGFNPPFSFDRPPPIPVRTARARRLSTSAARRRNRLTAFFRNPARDPAHHRARCFLFIGVWVCWIIAFCAVRSLGQWLLGPAATTCLKVMRFRCACSVLPAPARRVPSRSD